MTARIAIADITASPGNDAEHHRGRGRGRTHRGARLMNVINLNDQRVRNAVARVVEYLHDEEKDFSSDPRPGHIYEHVRVLRDALERK
jgi:hypothetical protein